MLQYIDSFEPYGTQSGTATSNQIRTDRRWTEGVAAVVGTGRNGCGIFLGVNSASSIFKTLPRNSGWVAGFAAKGLGNGQPTSPSLYSLESLNTSGGLDPVATLQINADLTATIKAGNSNVIATSTNSFSEGRFHYFEMKTTLGTSSGNIQATVTLRVNGQTVATGSGDSGVTVLSRIDGAAKAGVHRFNAAPNTGTVYDDLYICDTDGSLNNDFLGDIRVKLILATADVTTNWVTSSGTAHWSLTTEVPPDDDTTYVYSTATGSMDLYEWQDIAAFSGTIKGVQFSVYARKDNEGPRAIHLVEGSSGTNIIGGTGSDVYLNDEFYYHHFALDTSPTSGSAWTVAQFNASRFGFVVASNT